MKSERFDFQNAAGHTLAGRLELPSGPPTATAIFAHCFTCSKNIHAATRICRELAARGIAVLRFDFTGLGGSDGEFANTDFSSNVSDLISAAAALRERFRAPSLLVGHSLGGAAVLMAAGDIPEVRAIATIAAPSEPEHLADLLENRAPELKNDGEASIRLGGRTFRIGKAFLDDLRSHRLEHTLPELDKPILVFHSPADQSVPIEHARKLFYWAKHPKSFVSLDQADHLLTNPADTAYVAGVLTAWAMRYIAPESEDGSEEQGELPRGVVTVTEQHGFQQKITVGPHELLSDEPVKLGGTDTGPAPHELLLAGLGSCTSMTVRIYADRMKWPLKGVSVQVQRKQLRETGDDGKPKFVEKIDKTLTLDGELTDEQRHKLVEISNRCPVNRTLLNEKRIRTHLAEELADEPEAPEGN